MSSAAIPICYVDADGFGDTVTLTEHYDHTSADGLTTTTGTATWTYTRVRLADVAARPKLLWCLNPYTLTAAEVGTGRFLAVRCGMGSMPGWIVVFGPQDAVPGAITTTVSSDDPDTPPVVTHADAFCDPPSATCALVAPGVRTGADAGNDLSDPTSRTRVLGINRGVLAGSPVTGAAFEVTLIQPGFPENPGAGQPAVAPVYRITIPDDAGKIVCPLDGTGLSLVVNGTTEHAGLSDVLADLPAVLGSVNGQWQVEARSPWVCEVQLADPTDTLAAGTLDYLPFVPQASQVWFSGGLQTIANPFPMAGQSFSYGPDGSGRSATLQF